MTKTLQEVITGTLGIVLLSAGVRFARAQSASDQPEPYASISAKGADYSGPGRESAYDLTGATISVGLIVPLSGTRKAEGAEIVAAAKMGLEEAEKESSPALKLVLKTGDESGPSWSSVSSALSRLVLEDQSVAIITSTSGATAHLSEQVGNRFGVPVLTLASDKTTTQIDLPWIFRLGPTDGLEAQAIARDLYHKRGLKHVLLVTENDHDGRRGVSEFEQVAHVLGAPRPVSVILDPSRTDFDAFTEAIRTQAPEAIVLWTKSPAVRTLIEAARESASKAPIYLSREAAQSIPGVNELPAEDSASGKSNQADIWTVAAAGTSSRAKEEFSRRYRQATGDYPSAAAAEAYDAVRLVASALRKAGPNRARVRDEIAKTTDWQGASGTITFDAEGNNAVKVVLVRVPVSSTAFELTRRN